MMELLEGKARTALGVTGNRKSRQGVKKARRKKKDIGEAPRAL